MAPVAEYRGVALFEREGDKLTVWNGIEYYTDGLIWLCYRKLEGDEVRFVGLPDERVAKAYLDEHPDPATEFFSVQGNEHNAAGSTRPTATYPLHGMGRSSRAFRSERMRRGGTGLQTVAAFRI